MKAAGNQLTNPAKSSERWRDRPMRIVGIEGEIRFGPFACLDRPPTVEQVKTYLAELENRYDQADDSEKEKIMRGLLDFTVLGPTFTIEE